THLIKSSGASSEFSFGVHTGIVSIKTGNLEVSTDGIGRIMLYDTGHRAKRYISARDVLEGKVPAEKLDGQVVLVGASAIGLGNLVSTPLQDYLPAVEVQAEITEQMLEGQFLGRPDFADGAELLFLLLIGLLLVLLLPRLSAGWMAIVAAMFVAVGGA